MREAVTISNVSRMRAGPLGPYNALKTKICFEAFFPKNVFILFESPWGYGYLVPQWGHGILRVCFRVYFRSMDGMDV